MDVVNFLPDHPSAPQRHALEAFLPDLMPFLDLRKFKAAVDANDCFRSQRFQLAHVLLDATISGSDYERKVIRHEYIGDQLAGPISIEVLKLIQEDLAAFRVSEDR